MLGEGAGLLLRLLPKQNRPRNSNRALGAGVLTLALQTRSLMGSSSHTAVLCPPRVPTVMPRLKGAKPAVHEHTGVSLWPLQMGSKC